MSVRNYTQNVGARVIIDGLQVSKLCADARELCGRGCYEEAENVLAPVWAGVGRRPYLSSLSDGDGAEVLLLAATVTGYVGRRRKMQGAFEQAKDLLTQSLTIFCKLGDDEGKNRALGELALWYFRERSFGNAEDFCTDALQRVAHDQPAIKADLTIKLATVIARKGDWEGSLQLLRANEALFADNASRRFVFACTEAQVAAGYAHITHDTNDAIDALRLLARSRELAAKAGHSLLKAAAEANIAAVLATLGRCEAAHNYLDSAIRYADSVNSPDLRASMNGTRARIYVAEGKGDLAYRFIKNNIADIDENEQKGLLAESLFCAGEIAVQLRRYEEARAHFVKAAEAALYVGDLPLAQKAEVGLGGIANIDSLHEAKTRTIRWRMGDDSMTGAEVFKGRLYDFLRFVKWRDGDIVLVEVFGRRYICYIFDEPPARVRLECENEDCAPQSFSEAQVKVLGVIETEEM